MNKDRLQSMVLGILVVIVSIITAQVASHKEEPPAPSMTIEQYARAEAALRFAGY